MIGKYYRINSTINLNKGKVKKGTICLCYHSVMTLTDESYFLKNIETKHLAIILNTDDLFSFTEQVYPNLFDLFVKNYKEILEETIPYLKFESFIISTIIEDMQKNKLKDAFKKIMNNKAVVKNSFFNEVLHLNCIYI